MSTFTLSTRFGAINIQRNLVFPAMASSSPVPTLIVSVHTGFWGSRYT